MEYTYVCVILGSGALVSYVRRRKAADGQSRITHLTGDYGRKEMNRQIFLQKLKEALENDLSGRIVQDNLNFYSQYISDEIKKGRSEQEVVDELGDPWMIARTIIDSQDIQSGNENSGTYREQEGQSYETPHPMGNGGIHILGLDTWWKKLLVIAGVLLVIGIIISIITGIISLVAPVAVPVLIVVIVLQIIKGRKR